MNSHGGRYFPMGAAAVRPAAGVFAAPAATAALLLFALACSGGGGGSAGGTPTAGGAPAPSGTISGRVLEPVSGALSQASAAGGATRPSERARVSVPGTNLSTRTDENGEYRIVGVPPGVLDVTVEKDVDADGQPDLRVNVPGVAVTHDRGANLPPVEVAPTGAISGRAQLAGRATGNLGIALIIPGTDHVAYADDFGNYVIGGLAAGAYVVVARKDEYEAARLENVAVESGRITERQDFSLAALAAPRTGTLTGTVRLTGADMHGGIALSLNGAEQTAMTGAEGAFLLGDLPEGTYTLIASYPGYSTGRWDNVMVLGGVTYTVPTLYLTDLAAVTDFDGDGIPDDDDSDDDNDRYDDTDELAAGTDPRDPRSRPVGSLTGSVVLAGQTSHAGVLVTLAGSGRTWITQASGQFTFAEVPVGTYAVTFVKSNYAEEQVSIAPVGVGKITTLPVVTMNPTAGIDVTAPAGTVVTAGAATTDSLTFSWSGTTDDTIDAAGLAYRVFAAPYNFNAVSGLNPKAVTAAGAGTHTLTGLQADTLYTIAVLAFDVSGNLEAMSATNKITARTAGATPADTAAPAGTVVSAGTPTTSTIPLSWTAATDDVTATATLVYRVYAQTTDFTATAGLAPAATGAAGATGLTPAGLSANTQYFIAVVAVDEAGNEEAPGGANKTVAITAAPTSDLMAPTGTAVTAGTPTADSIPLTWTAATDDTSAASALVYRVYAETADFTSVAVLAPRATTAPGATGATATGLAASTQYFVAVLAVDEAGNVEAPTAANKAAAMTAAPPAPTETGGWTLETPAAAWSARSGHSSAVFHDKLWVIGGAGSGSYKNDVWSSADGVNWTQETAVAPWRARKDHTSAVFNNKLWVIGGDMTSDYGGLLNDVWSSPDGMNWSLETAAAPWSARSDHSSAVFNNRLWVIGGYVGAIVRGGRTSDVWSSSDGVNWVQETAAAPWGGRGSHTSAVFNNKLWVGGGDTNGTRANDVWSSSDGVNWTRETPAAPWSARGWHTSAVFNNKLWVIGGDYYSDVWASSDGVNWVQETAAAPWGVRWNHTSVVFNNSLWVIGGSGIDYRNWNDVWSFQ